MKLCPRQSSEWLCLLCVFPLTSPSLGGTVSRLRGPSIGPPFPCHHATGWTGRFCPCQYAFDKVSIGRRRGAGGRRGPIPQLANVIQVHVSLKPAFTSLAPTCPAPLHTSWSCSRVPRAGENWLFPAASLLLCWRYQKGQSMVAKIHVLLTMFLLCRGCFSPPFLLKNLLCVREMKPGDKCLFDG